MKILNKVLYTIVFLIFFSACNLASTQTPAPINTAMPLVVNSNNCNADDVLKNLKTNLPFGEFTVLHNEIKGSKTLVLWLVDPEINANATEAEIPDNVTEAIRVAVNASYLLLTSNECVSTLFDYISPIIVDTNYNGWFSGQISPLSLPMPKPENDNEIVNVGNNFEIGFLRQNTTTPITLPSSGSCTWQEANQKLHLHFSPERQNVGFHFVLDNVGTNVWAQWNTKEEYLKNDIFASLLNITMEIQCIHPQPDNLIFIIVNDSGETLVMGVVPKEGIQAYPNIFDKVKILYEKE